MRDVLVSFASRHGATEEIAHAIGAGLEQSGLSVDVRSMDDVAEIDDLRNYSAFVLGSAVYMGSWIPRAQTFVHLHREVIAERPTWLFSSGPVGDVPGNGTKGFDAADLVAETHARDHHLFGGRLDRRMLSRRERLIAGLVRARDGDDRDWAILAAWVTAISHALAPVATQGG